MTYFPIPRVNFPHQGHHNILKNQNRHNTIMLQKRNTFNKTALVDGIHSHDPLTPCALRDGTRRQSTQCITRKVKFPPQRTPRAQFSRSRKIFTINK